MKRKKRVKKRKLDPKNLPKPLDFHGFDSTMVRLVPEINQLMEIQTVVPAHIFDEIADIVENFKGIEVDRKIGRIVSRGRKRKATNIFLDRER